MTKTHRRTTQRCCAHCGQHFTVNPRLGRRHRFCSRPDCAAASRQVARKKWLKKNGGRRYFAGKENGDRVRNWRRRNPLYWKRARGPQRDRGSKMMLTPALAEVMRYVALQDTIDTRFALEIGLIAEVSGAALQDTIAKEIRRLIMRGYAILRGKPSKR
jgi:hypothetical protein